MPAFASPDNRNLLLGRGKVFIDKFDPVTGLPTGTLSDMGNCSEFQVSIKAEIKEKYTSQDPTGNLLARATTRQTVTIKITADEFTAQNIASALNGTVNNDGTISVAAVPAVAAHVQFVGNPVKGPAYQADFWHVEFTPTGSVGFIKDDFADLPLEGMVIADPGHPASETGLITPL